MTNLTNKSYHSVRGLNIVFTGNGKGKTTAAMGMLLRAYGQGLSTGVIQFVKGPGRIYGEAVSAFQMNIPFRTLGKGFIRKRSYQEELRLAAIGAWEEAQKWICSLKYDVLILDEVTYLFHYEWLDVSEFIDWIKQNKPFLLHLVMTGRYAPPELIDFADLVTEMQEVKHPFRQQGIPAQAGVDY